MTARSLWVLIPLLLAACRGPAEMEPSSAHVRTVEAFRDARADGDLEAARRLVVDDPRVWYGERSGDGEPWDLGGGRWSAWDEHFGSTSDYGPWHVEPDSVWADVLEMNDYFRLTERGPGWWRATYFLADDGRIAGFLVSSVPGRPGDRGRRDEFEAWAREHDPEEAGYLMPDGAIDPTGDRPERMRALLLRWRAAVGLGS